MKKFFITYKRIVSLAYQVNSRLLFLITFSNAFWGLTNLPVLYINKILIDLVVANIGHTDWELAAKTIIYLIILRSLIELLRSFLSQYNYAISSQLSNSINNHLDILLGEKLNSLDISTVENPQFQDKYKKVNRESSSRIWGMISTLSDIPNSVFTIISGVIPLFSFQPVIGLIVILLNLPQAVYNGILAKLDYADRDKMNKEYRTWGWLSWIITDTNQIYENKLYNTVGYLSQKLKKIQSYIYEIDQKMRLRRVKLRTLSDIPQWFFSMFLNSYFFILALTGKISLGLAQMLYQSANTLSNGFGMLTNNIAIVYENYLAIEDFTWYMDLPPKSNKGTKLFPKVITQGICFENVWFKYPTSPDWILKNITLNIGPKDNIALVGENGVGKTTLLKLLFGFYKPQKGTIKIDGTPIEKFRQSSYWNHISSLQQDFHLFPFTAKESIAFSDLTRVSNISEIKTAAKSTNIDDYIESLPLKYDTPLTKELEKGVEPSTGQRQRIGLARALFKKSLILILDEPTSNVDPKAEEEIFDNIIKLTKEQILILVSHRFSTVRRADKILVMDGGQIVETGIHEELMGLNGLYSKLFTLQAKSYQ